MRFAAVFLAMLTPAAVEIRPTIPADLAALARFIAAHNAAPESECLHCAAKTSAGVRAALREEFGDGGEAWARTFALAARRDPDGGPATILGAVGCQLAPSGDSGWLWGPWLTEAAPTDVPTARLGASLFACLWAILPPKARRIDAFLNSANAHGLRLLQAQGFALRQQTHVYVAQCRVLPADFRKPADGSATAPDHRAAVVFSELRLSQETTFARLHAETFPSGESARAEDLLAGRDDERRIFAAAEGLRLLGYICVSVNRAPREGFIDYLAVRQNARGRGIGLELLQAAQRWIFEERQLPQAALCVSDWRSGARHLYERAGFILYASGTGARRRW